MRINHNLASLNIYRNYVKDLDSQSAALGRISTGIKINGAKDGAGALARSERMRVQIASMQMAARNTQDGISLVQTAESGVESISESLQRIRELVIYSGGMTNEGDKEIIQSEIEQLKQAIDGFAKDTDFNGLNPLNVDKIVKTTVGANSGEVVEVPFYNLNTSNLKANLKETVNPDGTITVTTMKTPDATTIEKTVKDIDITGSTPATTIDEALNILDVSISKMNDVRSKYGAVSNRFEDCYNDLNEFSEKLQGTESAIRDTDVGEEMMNYTKDGLLINASQAMLAQTNRFPQDILRILENVRSR